MDIVSINYAIISVVMRELSLFMFSSNPLRAGDYIIRTNEVMAVAALALPAKIKIRKLFYCYARAKIFKINSISLCRRKYEALFR
jgi:hypothetical protein